MICTNCNYAMKLNFSLFCTILRWLPFFICGQGQLLCIISLWTFIVCARNNDAEEKGKRISRDMDNINYNIKRWNRPVLFLQCITLKFLRVSYNRLKVGLLFRKSWKRIQREKKQMESTHSLGEKKPLQTT